MESVGDEVTNFKEGDVVIPIYVGECGECENCASKESNICLRYPLSVSGLMPDGTSRISVGGKKAYHVFSCSTWCEYMVSDENYLMKVDPSIDLAHASFISCGFSTGFGASWKTAQVQSGSSVAVLGLGAVGLGVCAFYKTKFIIYKKNKINMQICLVLFQFCFLNQNLVILPLLIGSL